MEIILGSVGNMVSATIIQLCRGSAKAASHGQFTNKSAPLCSRETLFVAWAGGHLGFWVIIHRPPRRGQWMDKDDHNYIGDLPGQKWKKTRMGLKAHSYEGQEPALLRTRL